MSFSGRPAALGRHEPAGLRVRDRALALAVVVWSVAMVAQFVGLTTFASSGKAVDAMLAAPPLALIAVWSLSNWEASPNLRLMTGWACVLAAVLLLAPAAVSTPSFALAFPGILALSLLVTLRPAFGVALLLAVTASFGSLHIYLNWPFKRTLVALLAALAVAAIGRFVASHREPLRLPLCASLVAAYLIASVVQYLFAADPGVASGGLQLAPLYMATVLVFAYSQWSDATHGRLLRSLVGIALAVGAYATLRQVIGPSAPEAHEAALSPYNVVADHHRLTGSFLEAPELAEWTALAIPVCLSCILGARGRLRLAALVALPLLAVGLFGSQARVGAVAVTAAALAVIVLHGVSRATPRFRLGGVALAVGLMAVLVVVAYQVTGASEPGSGHSYLALLEGKNSDVSLAAHRYKWGQAIGDLAGHPFGYGLGTSPAGYVANAPSNPILLPVTGFSVDNGFLKIALEQGFAVMLIFGAAIVALTIYLITAAVRTRDRDRAVIVIAAAGAGISFFILEGAGVYADGIPSILAWAAMGVGVAQSFRVRHETEWRGQALASSG